jgi:hypothetical protein
MTNGGSASKTRADAVRIIGFVQECRRSLKSNQANHQNCTLAEAGFALPIPLSDAA